MVHLAVTTAFSEDMRRDYFRFGDEFLDPNEYELRCRAINAQHMVNLYGWVKMHPEKPELNIRERMLLRKAEKTLEELSEHPELQKGMPTE